MKKRGGPEAPGKRWKLFPSSFLDIHWEYEGGMKEKIPFFGVFLVYFWVKRFHAIQIFGSNASPELLSQLDHGYFIGIAPQPTEVGISLEFP